MPQPVSLTSTTTRDPSAPARARRMRADRPAPSGMACAALMSRFRNTWPSRCALAATGGTGRRSRLELRPVPQLVLRQAHGRAQHRPAGRTSSASRSSGAREGLEITHDLADPLRPLARVLERPHHLAGRGAGPRQLLERVGEVREDEGERVVDLVRHAGRERAERRHAVGEEELRLERALLGDVLHHGDGVLERAVRHRARRWRARRRAGCGRPCPGSGARRRRRRAGRASSPAARPRRLRRAPGRGAGAGACRSAPPASSPASAERTWLCSSTRPSPSTRWMPMPAL